MKRIIFFCILTALLIQDTHASSRSKRGEMVVSGLVQARVILKEAIKNADDPVYKAYYIKVLNKLNTDVDIYYPEYKRDDFIGCFQKDHLWAFTFPRINNRKIYLCDDFFSRFSDAFAFGQLLIHETAHLVGLLNECDATYIEVYAMKTANTPLAFKNGYMEKCF